MEKLQKDGVKEDFHLFCGDPKLAQALPPEVRQDSYLPYPTVLQQMQSSKCILDMTQAGQSGITLRYYEAVVYNKKLLTNNVNIVNLPFYNPQYMKIYETIEDIDGDWIQSKDMPNYEYAGEFSPVHILELLEAESN